LTFWEHYVKGNACKIHFDIGHHRKKETLDYIHDDLWGLSTTLSHFEAKYFLLIVDDYLRKLWS